MKRLLSLLLIVAILSSMAACGSNNTQKATNPTAETTPPEGETIDSLHQHSYTSEVTAPGCSNDGYTTYTCACGDHYVGDTVPAVGHAFGQWVVVTAPTETATGLSERKCAACGTTETRVQGAILPDHTHSYTTKELSAPTCTKEGERSLTCACGESYTEKVAKTPHNTEELVLAPDCVNSGYTTHKCKDCGASYVDSHTAALGHDYKETVIPSTCVSRGQKKTLCSRCGSGRTEKLPYGEHSYVSATCSQPQQCSVCGRLGDNALGHSYGADHICTRCGMAESGYESGPVNFSVTVRSDKGKVVPGVTVTVFVGDAQVGVGTTDSVGVAKLQLTDSGRSYQIVLTNVPQAYEAKPSYSFSSTVVSINLTTVPVLDPNDHSQAMYTAGSTMANFVLTDIDDNTYDLSQLRQQKKLIILDFWYVNCAPCKKEFPYFQSMLEQYGDDVILLAVNNIDSEESMRQLREELAADPATAVTFPMIKDTLGLSQGFGVTAYPVTVFIDPDGKVVSVHKDAFASEEAFLTQVKKYLK